MDFSDRYFLRQIMGQIPRTSKSIAPPPVNFCKTYFSEKMDLRGPLLFCLQKTFLNDEVISVGGVFLILKKHSSPSFHQCSWTLCTANSMEVSNMQTFDSNKKVNLKPTLPEKTELDGGAFRCQHTLVSCYSKCLSTFPPPLFLE